MKILLYIALAYGAWLILGCAVQRQFLYPRGSVVPHDEPGAGVEGLEQLWLDTDAGPVEAWILPGHGVSAANPGPAVIFGHGNAEVIDYWPDVFERYRALGVTVMLCEYRGYGRSAGKPTQAGIVDDFVRFYELLAARPDVDAARIVFHGRSLGTGVVCQLATHHKPAALILQSPFTSVASIMATFLIPRFACLDPYDSAAVLKDLDAPVLILHGRHDRIIPFTHGQELDALAPRSTLIPYDCGHNDFPVMSERYWADLTQYLREQKIIDAPPEDSPVAE